MELQSGKVLIEIFLIFGAAKILGWLLQKVGQPAVVGELSAGILIGPYALRVVHTGPVVNVVAEIGVVVLLFSAGLEQRLSELMRVGWISTRVAVLGVLLPFVLGFGAGLVFRHSHPESVFLGTALVATSVGITARVLGEVGQQQSSSGRIILGAAVIDDILGMIILAVVSGVTLGQKDARQIVIAVALALGLVIFVLGAGRGVVRRVVPRVASFTRQKSYFSLALLICLGLSVLAVEVGIAAIIGAFLAGLVFSEEKAAEDLRIKTHAVYEFGVPFFFVAMGMAMDVRLFARKEIFQVAAIVTLLAIVGKLVGCSLAAMNLGWLEASRIGVGMVPRGEVGLIVALIGLNQKVMSGQLYSIIVIMSLITTMIVPPVLSRLYRKTGPVPPPKTSASHLSSQVGCFS